IGGTARIATVIAEPGVISHTSPFAMFRAGRADGAADEPLSAFGKAAKDAKVDFAAVSNIEQEIWEEFILLAAVSAITAGTRQPMGKIVADPDMKQLFRNLMSEVLAIAKAQEIEVRANYVDDQLTFAEQKMDKGMKASMAHDLERGNRLELDWLSGKVVALGRKLGIKTPANETVYALLKPYRMGRSA